MPRVVAALTFALALLLPGTVAAEGPAFSPAELTRQQAVLALIPFPWQQLDYEIVFLPPRRGYRAMTFPQKRRIEVYARPQDDIRLIAYDIAHELGHVIDLVHNTAEKRNQWKAARGVAPSTTWFGCSRCSDYNTPAGDFAETFALLVFGPEDFRGRIAPRPSEKQLQALKSFFPILNSNPPIPSDLPVDAPIDAPVVVAEQTTTAGSKLP